MQTQSYELTTPEYTRVMVALLRRRMVWFDLLAGAIVLGVARFILHFDWGTAAFLAPIPPILGYFRVPIRVRRMADHPNSGRPVGNQTMHPDAGGLIYSGGAMGPLVLKWDEIRSVRLVEGVYVLDAGSEDILVTPSAFPTARDEEGWQTALRENVKRRSGF